jgi:antitoxin FitA
MATLHIRDLKDSVKESLRVRAARNGRSMEAEARSILEEAARQAPEDHLYDRVRKLAEQYGPMDMEVPPREGLTGAQFVALVRAAVATYGPLDIEIPPRGPSHREIPDFS